MLPAMIAPNTRPKYCVGTSSTRSTTNDTPDKYAPSPPNICLLYTSISPEAVEWKDGEAVPAGANAGGFDPLPLAAIAMKAAKTGGPIGSEISVNAQGAGPGFGAHLCDIEIDPETGHATITRYTCLLYTSRCV